MLKEYELTKTASVPSFDLTIGDPNYWTERLSYELLKIHEGMVDEGMVVRQSDEDYEETLYKGLVGEVDSTEYSFIELLQNTPLVIRIDKKESFQDIEYHADT